MTYRTSLVLAAAAVLSASTFAQTQRSALGVRIQSTFKAADANKNGTVSVLEAAKAGIPPVSFAKHDGDKDRRLSATEFESYYRQLIAVRRKEQATRIAAQKARSKRRSFKPVTGTVPPTPVVAPEKNVQPSDSVGKPAPVNPAPTNPDVLVAVPVQPAPKTPTSKVVRKNRDILQAQAVGKQFVKDLQSKGKLSAKDATDMVQVLTLPTPGKDAAANFVEWRAALNNARTRITALVQSNALSADEGRAMYKLFEQRAKDAVNWQESGGVTEIKPDVNKVGALDARKVNGTVAGKVKPVNGKTATAGADDEAAAKRAHDQQRVEDARASKNAHDQQRVEDARARKKAHDQQRVEDARARKQEHDKQRVLDARAAKQAHDRQRIEAARAKAAEEQADKERKQKAPQAKKGTAKGAQISKQGTKSAPKRKPTNGAKPTSGAAKPKGDAAKPQAKKLGTGTRGPAGKTPSKVPGKSSPSKKGGK